MIKTNKTSDYITYPCSQEFCNSNFPTSVLNPGDQPANVTHGDNYYLMNDRNSSMSTSSTTSSSLDNWFNYLDTSSKEQKKLTKMYLTFPSSDIVNMTGGKTSFHGRRSRVLKNRFNQWILFAERNKTVDLTMNITDHELDMKKLHDYQLRFTPIGYIDGKKSPLENIPTSFMEFRGFDVISNRDLSSKEDELENLTAVNSTVDGYKTIDVRLPLHVCENNQSKSHFKIPIRIAFPHLNSKCIGKLRKDIYILIELFFKDQRVCCSQFFVISCSCPSRDSERYIKRNTEKNKKILKRKGPSNILPKLSSEKYVITTDDENIYRTLCLVKDQMLLLKRQTLQNSTQYENNPTSICLNQNSELISSLDMDLFSDTQIAGIFGDYEQTNSN